MTHKNRYIRQSILPEISEEGQKKILASSVLCVGAGGLGCPSLLYLAAAGVGRIGIIDFDVVDESNLQRQILFTVDQIGKNKAEAAKQQLSALNPTIDIQAYAEELTHKNAEKLFGDYNVIIDGTDNFASKFLINDTAVKMQKPFVYGSILGFKGQMSVFNFEDGPCYRCLFPEAPKAHIPNCAEAGVIGAVAGMIGAAQAMEALKIIVGHERFKSLSGTFLTIDMCTMDNLQISLLKDPACPTCRKEKEAITLQYSSPLCSAITEITPQQAQAGDNVLFIDVRETNEWNAGHIEGAQHIALSTLIRGDIPDLPEAREIVVYCQKGKRGQQATQIFKARGYESVKNMVGGYECWLECS